MPIIKKICRPLLGLTKLPFEFKLNSACLSETEVILPDSAVETRIKEMLREWTTFLQKNVPQKAWHIWLAVEQAINLQIQEVVGRLSLTKSHTQQLAAAIKYTAIHYILVACRRGLPLYPMSLADKPLEAQSVPPVLSREEEGAPPASVPPSPSSQVVVGKLQIQSIIASITIQPSPAEKTTIKDILQDLRSKIADLGKLIEAYDADEVKQQVLIEINNILEKVAQRVQSQQNLTPEDKKNNRR